ncbi:unnamed protein product, partial [Allacma fusca]
QLAQHIRLLLEYLDVKYEDKRYPYGPGPTYDTKSWLAEKFELGLAFPNIPYFIDDKVKLTESRGILKYIARTRGPQLVPSDAVTLAVADEIEGVGADLQRTLIDVTYGRTTYEAVKETVELKLKYVNNFLDGRQYVAGNQLTYVDFFLYEILFQYGRFGETVKNDILKPHQNINNYVRSFESLPKLKGFIQSTSKNVVYSPHATILY